MDEKDTQQTIVMKAYVDGKRVVVEKQPRLQPTRLTLEHGFQLFGGDKVSALHMNGGVLKHLEIKSGVHAESDVQVWMVEHGF